MNMMDKNTEAHFSEIEVQDRLDKLGNADIARLLQIYRTLGCFARSRLSEHDVLNQVVVKALSLERRWPKNVKTINFFIETGKSIISNEAEKHSKLNITSTIDDELLMPINSTAKLSHPTVESHIEHSQSDNVIFTWVQKIQQLFENDSDADCFINQKLNEQKKSRILILCDFTDQVYRNVEKRIKDKVRKKFPNGLPWWEVES